MLKLIALSAVAVALAGPAAAHAVLSPPEAPADSYFKATIGVGHGCEGTPTLRVRVRIPEGIVSVKPMPKAGWELSIKREQLAQPITEPRGRRVTERVSEVMWSGTLLDENFDEFVMQLRLPDKAGETLYFATVQECEKGVHRWIEIPAAGQGSGDLREPAPVLKLLPKRGAH
jgi:periplasmic copper chaperone A